MCSSVIFVAAANGPNPRSMAGWRAPESRLAPSRGVAGGAASRCQPGRRPPLAATSALAPPGARAGYRTAGKLPSKGLTAGGGGERGTYKPLTTRTCAHAVTRAPDSAPDHARRASRAPRDAARRGRAGRRQAVRVACGLRAVPKRPLWTGGRKRVL